ncbi:hypothetical protein V865_002984 [Kwoniella europaea PYCC6329]|uniref:Uncharacterized protein n=1 Tax=Kwoniella europaea PYCC6329 TaxID=1423913 RepID=A0AAX4KHR2_9TREE
MSQPSRPQTPGPSPYLPQKRFPIRDRRGQLTDFLEDQNEAQALQAAIRVARRIFFCSKSVRIVAKLLSMTGPNAFSRSSLSPLNDVDSVMIDEGVVRGIQVFKKWGIMDIVLDPHMRDYGPVSMAVPNQIRIKYNVWSSRESVKAETVPPLPKDNDPSPTWGSVSKYKDEHVFKLSSAGVKDDLLAEHGLIQREDVKTAGSNQHHDLIENSTGRFGFKLEENTRISI